mmetsp:Transcript_64483/g.127486  ORF Transcript_64483/g.127486 Transcript_64483/m.127486 type:complete len:212 (+) Transcript_64483:856-1491(+)
MYVKTPWPKKIPKMYNTSANSTTDHSSARVDPSNPEINKRSSRKTPTKRMMRNRRISLTIRSTRKIRVSPPGLSPPVTIPIMTSEKPATMSNVSKACQPLSFVAKKRRWKAPNRIAHSMIKMKVKRLSTALKPASLVNPPDCASVSKTCVFAPMTREFVTMRKPEAASKYGCDTTFNNLWRMVFAQKRLLSLTMVLCSLCNFVCSFSSCSF